MSLKKIAQLSSKENVNFISLQKNQKFKLPKIRTSVKKIANFIA